MQPSEKTRCGDCDEATPTADNGDMLLIVRCGKLDKTMSANNFCKLGEVE